MQGSCRRFRPHRREILAASDRISSILVSLLRLGRPRTDNFCQPRPAPAPSGHQLPAAGTDRVRCRHASDLRHLPSISPAMCVMWTLTLTFNGPDSAAVRGRAWTGTGGLTQVGEFVLDVAERRLDDQVRPTFAAKATPERRGSGRCRRCRPTRGQQPLDRPEPHAGTVWLAPRTSIVLPASCGHLSRALDGDEFASTRCRALGRRA